MWPNLFALGAEIGTPEVLINYNAILWLGQRNPTNPVPAITYYGNIFYFAFKTIVNGPGQNFLLNI